MKNIVLVRHAKSSWENMFLSDHDRPLNPRGKKDAPDMGDRLKARELKPSLIISSTAKRARLTAKKIAKKIGFSKDRIMLTKALYHADDYSIFEIIKSLDDAHDTVMLFGHNPGITECANLLTGNNIINIPTCGAASISFNCSSWKDIEKRAGSMIFYDYPKKPQGG
jgi:phosphohistidine phosphatase